MKKNNTIPGNDPSEDSASIEVAQSNMESVKHAPKDLSKLNLRAWFHIETLLRQTKVEREENSRLKKLWGRIGDS